MVATVTAMRKYTTISKQIKIKLKKDKTKKRHFKINKKNDKSIKNSAQK